MVAASLLLNTAPKKAFEGGYTNPWEAVSIFYESLVIVFTYVSLNFTDV